MIGGGAKKNEKKGYYGFDSSGLEKAAVVGTRISLGCEISRRVEEFSECIRARNEGRRDEASSS